MSYRGDSGAPCSSNWPALHLASKVSVMGIPDRFLPAGTVDDLLTELGLDVDSLVGRVAILLGE